MMKPKVITLLFLLMYLGSYAGGRDLSCGADTGKHHQKIPSKPLTLRQLQILNKRHKPWFDDCTFTDQYTIEQRLKKHPFSKAVKVLAVSYRSLDEPEGPAVQDSLEKGLLSAEAKKLRGGLHIVKDSLDYSTLQEFKQLNQDQINQLTNLIYNTNYKKIDFNSTGGASCYNPRNAIIFFDEKGKVYDYLEICFACQHSASKSKRLNVGVLCAQKYDMLRKYFINVGVNYGTVKNMHGD